MKLISGSKGDDSKAPVESPNTLKSTALAKIIDLVSEGEIVGLVDGMKSVFLDETPLQNADDTLNFKNVILEHRYGTQTQDPLLGFADVENEIAVGVELIYGTPWTHNVTNLDLDAVRIRISVLALTTTDTKTGDIKGGNIGYAIDMAIDGGPYVQVLSATFNGKTNTKYERIHRIDLPTQTFGSTGWQFRVRRTTTNSVSSAVADKTYIESYTEIIDQKLRYPNSALVGITIDSSQFSSIPTRGYDLKGRIIRVPTNYDPETRIYTGIWDGTFQLAWTDNPAWCFYDLCTHTRYGLGHLIQDGQVNKWKLYEIAQYCDELVSDGNGGTEPRFTCNMYLQTQADAFKALQDLATVFRGMTYWGNGEVHAVADMPEDPVFTYTPANVVNGNFIYQGSAKKTRATVALVSWSDPDDFGRQKIEYVDDQDGIQRYGVQQVDATAIGCTSRSQAQRLGRYILLTGIFETDTVGFSIGIDGTVVAPGKVIRIADPLRAGKRMGGRLATVLALNQVTLDALPANVRPGDTITVQVPSTGVAETRTILSVGEIQESEIALSAVTNAGLTSAVGLTFGGFSSIDILTVEVITDGTYLAWSPWSTDVGNPSPWTDSFNVTNATAETSTYYGLGYASAAAANASVSTMDLVELTGSTSYTFWLSDNPAGDNRGGLSLRLTKRTNLITVSSNFSEAIRPGNVWAIDRATLQTQRYRVISVSESTEDGVQYSINAVRHNESKFAAVDTGTAIIVPPISDYPAVFQGRPTDVVITINQFAIASLVVVRAAATWTRPEGAVKYELDYQRDNGIWQKLGFTTNLTIDLPDDVSGTYTVRVRAYNAINIKSSYAESDPTLVLDPVQVPGYYREELEIVSGVVTVDCSLSEHFSLELTADATLEFINVPFSERVVLIDLYQRGTGSDYDLTLPGTVRYVSGVPYVTSKILDAEDGLGFYTNSRGVMWAMRYSKNVNFEIGGPTTGLMTAIATPNPLYGYAAASPSAAVTITPSGGTGPYTYAWTRAAGGNGDWAGSTTNDGGGNFSLTSSTVYNPTFSRTGGSSGPVTQNWLCTITDSLSATTTVLLEVQLEDDGATMGGGGGYTCPSIDAWLPGIDGPPRQAASINVGDYVWAIDPETNEEFKVQVTHTSMAWSHAVTITTAIGVSLTCSKTAPLATPGGYQMAELMVGEQTLVFKNGDWVWSLVIAVTDVGEIAVQHITCANKFFLVGDTIGEYMAHHNIKWEPSGPGFGE